MVTNNTTCVCTLKVTKFYVKVFNCYVIVSSWENTRIATAIDNCAVNSNTVTVEVTLEARISACVVFTTVFNFVKVVVICQTTVKVKVTCRKVETCDAVSNFVVFTSTSCAAGISFCKIYKLFGRVDDDWVVFGTLFTVICEFCVVVCACTTHFGKI